MFCSQSLSSPTSGQSKEKGTNFGHLLTRGSMQRDYQQGAWRVWRICTPNIEMLSLLLHPSYFPSEFTRIFLTVVYTHPKAKNDKAANIIFSVTQEFDEISPDAPKHAPIMG